MRRDINDLQKKIVTKDELQEMRDSMEAKLDTKMDSMEDKLMDSMEAKMDSMESKIMEVMKNFVT